MAASVRRRIGRLQNIKMAGKPEGILMRNTVLLCSTAAFAMMSPATLRAQTSTTANPVPAPIESTPPAQTGVAGANTTPQNGPAISGDGSTASQEATKDIVVTGTLLRGIAPTGTNVIGISRAAITTTGVANSNDLLARIPQTGLFNQLPTPTADQGLPISRPNIRNLGNSGGSTTLVLVNGFRVVGQGILQTSPDPSIIPPGILDRVDVIPDGGSSIYGSDAIGGVVNFITRRRLNGIEADARYGFASHYSTYDANLTAGRDWGSGSLLLSYAYAHHDDLLGSDRSYINSNQTGRGGTDRRVLTCSPGTVTANGANYALPNFAPGTNLCDEQRQIDFYPSETRHSVFGSLTQQLNDAVEFNLTAYYSQRRTATIGFGTTNGTGLRGSGTITAANPYFRPVAGAASETVNFSYAGVAPANEGRSYAFLNSYGATPSFNFKLGGGWQLRTSANVGRSLTEINGYRTNDAATATALAGTTTATALNPYNLSGTNPAVLDSIFNYDDHGRSVQEIAEGRAVLDGSLARLPGGSVRLAVGYEHHYEDLSQTTTLGRAGTTDGYSHGLQSRSVNSIFGEVFVPIFGPENATSGMHSLDLSGSVRYDRYNDVGGTTNPKFGINYRPVESLKIRGNWGTSFHAPSLSDLGGSVDTRLQVLSVSPFQAAGTPFFPTILRPTILIAGGNPALRPETAHTWSAGADFTPSIVPGLTISGTYWNVDFKDAIVVPPFYNGAAFFANPAYAGLVTFGPTLAQLQALGNFRVDGPPLASLYGGPFTPYVLIDARRNNFSRVKTDGIDFNVVYNRTTGFGAVNASVAGTYTLSRRSQAAVGAAYSDDLQNGNSRLNMVGSVGAKAGPLNAQVTANYSEGYPIQGGTNQTRIGSFTSVNLFTSLDLTHGGRFGQSALTLNIDNLFDRDPPYSSLTANGVAFTNLGRVITVGIRTKL